MEELKPLMELLGGRAGWIVTAVAWVGALRILAKPVGGIVQAAMTKAVSFALGTPEPDDDALMVRVLASAPYRAVAFVVDWLTSIKLPNSTALKKE